MLLQGNLQGLQHLGIPVTNIERSKEFYKQFGFKETLNAELPEKSDCIKVAMLEHCGFTIELFQLTKDELEAVKNRSNGHIDHVALDVLDIDKAYKEIKSAGYKILEDNAPVALPLWDKGVKYFTICGPDGEKIEFNQRIK